MLLEREWTLKHEESLIVTLGSRIRHARVTKGYDTQAKFRSALRNVGADASISNISDIENDRSKPSLDLLISMAVVLGRSLDWLCCMPEEKTSCDEPVYSDAALDVANKIDSLPFDIKSDVIQDVLRFIQDQYDDYDLKREFKRLLTLANDNGDRSVIESVRRIVAVKRINNIVQ